MRRLSGLLCLLAFALSGCGSHQSTKLHSPDQKPAAQGKQTLAKNESEQVIAQARQHYFLGEQELNLGHLDKAKDEFNASLDVLMEYQSKHDPNAGVQAVIDELQNKIFDHEMAALKEGDGFTQHPLEPALIDDLKNIDTFPSPDMETKNEVEQDLKNTAFTIPVQVNDSVLSFIRIFQNSRRDELGGGLIRSGRYINAMKQI